MRPPAANASAARREAVEHAPTSAEQRSKDGRAEPSPLVEPHGRSLLPLCHPQQPLRRLPCSRERDSSARAPDAARLVVRCGGSYAVGGLRSPRAALEPAATAADSTRPADPGAGEDDARPVITPEEPTIRGARLDFDGSTTVSTPSQPPQPLDAADVSKVVQWARTSGVHIVARSGGHSYGGYSTTTGVVVDLSRLAGVQVTGGPGSRRPGARLGNIYDTLGHHGLAIPAGTCPSVGIGGHALGGGFGLASRAWGLASDNLVSIQIVTADGKVLDRRHDPAHATSSGPAGAAAAATSASSRGSSSARMPSRRARTSSPAGRGPGRGGARELPPLGARPRPTRSARSAGSRRARAADGAGVRPVPRQRDEAEGGARDARAARAEARTGTASWLDLVRRWAGCLGHTLPACSAPGHQGFVGASDYIARVPTAAQLRASGASIERADPAPGALLIDSYGGALNRVAPHGDGVRPSRQARVDPVLRRAATQASARWWVNASRATLAPATSGAAYVNYIDPRPPRTGRTRTTAGTSPRLQQVKRPTTRTTSSTSPEHPPGLRQSVRESERPSCRRHAQLGFRRAGTGSRRRRDRPVPPTGQRCSRHRPRRTT